MGASTKRRAARKRGSLAESGVGRKTDPRVKRASDPPPNASPSPTPPVWDVRNRLQENYQRVLEILEEMDGDPEARGKLAAVIELRRHIELADRTLEKTVDRDAQRLFEERVLAALETVDAADSAEARARQKVIDVLNGQVDRGNAERRRETGDRGRGHGAGGAGRPVAEPKKAGED